MIDMGKTIAPKSDQLNADDLIAGPMTITITRVSANPESAEQPVSIYFEGDNGKPYKACKSMRRVMVAAWDRDASQYTGRSMTLYRDPSVKFGGLEVGGIRISHMSHIDRPLTMALTSTRAQRKPYTVKPIETTRQELSPVDQYAIEFGANLKSMSPVDLANWWSDTADRRAEIGVPEDREHKMNVALARKLESEGSNGK